MKAAAASRVRYVRAWTVRPRVARPDPQDAAVESEPAESSGPPEAIEGHVLLVRATDVASAARGVAGVTRVTREPGEIWNISADHDVSAEVARRIADKGLLKLLINVRPSDRRALMEFLAKHQA